MSKGRGNIYFGIGLDNAQLRADAQQSKNILNSISKTAVQEGNSIDATYNRIGKTIAGVFTVQQAARFVKQLVSVRGEIESLQRSFEVLAGRVQGKKLFEDIREFAVTTPMQLNDLAKGAQTLLGFNVAAQEVMPILRSIGDIAMGDAHRFNSLTLAFAQMSAAGRLMGQDLLQMVNAGFNPLTFMAEKTGKSVADLKEEMSDGAVSADMVKQAFIEATEAGGRFNGMLEAQGHGIKGSIAKLEGAIQNMLNELGTSSQDVIVDAIQAATNLVKSYEKVGEVIGELIVTYGLYKATLITLTATKGIATAANAGWTASEILHFNALVLVEKAQKALNATILKNPYVLVAAAVATLAYGMYKLATRQTEADKALERLNDTTHKYNKEAAAEQVQIDALFARLKAAQKGTDEYKAAKEAILAQYGDYINGLNKEIRTLEDVEGAYKAVTKAVQEAAKARALDAATKDAADAFADTSAESKDKIYKAIKKQYGNKKDKDGMALAEKVYWELMNAIDNGQQISDKFLKQFEKEHFVAGNPTGNVDGTSYKSNAVADEIYKLLEAKKVFNDEVEEANRLFGSSPLGSIGGEVEETKAEAIKNKKYWEDYIKEQQAIIDSMTTAQIKAGEAKEQFANIEKAQGELKLYDTKKGTGKGGNDANNIAVQIAERKDQLDEYKKALGREERQAALDIAQAKIDGMKEGLEKELAQNEQNYKVLEEANLKRREDMVEALRDTKALEWENANPKAKKEGKTFDRRTITEEDLSDKQKEILREYNRIASESYVKANKDSLEKSLKDVLDYEQKRTEITEEYARKRAELYTESENGTPKLREGATEANVSEVDRQAEEALKSVDEQFAQREVTYQAWCDTIATLSLRQLQGVLEQAERELKRLEETGAGNSKQLAVARAKVATARQKLARENAKTDVAPNKRSIEQWNTLREALDACRNSFEEIGESVGGVAGEIISSTGSILGSTLSAVNSVAQLVNSATSGMVETATIAEMAISAVEKASVVLAVISAALQIATKIAQLFNSDGSKQKEIGQLQERIDQLQWELDNQEAQRVSEAYGTAIDRLASAYASATAEIIEMYAEVGEQSDTQLEKIVRFGKGGLIYEKTINKIADAYANMDYTASKALGVQRFERARKHLENLAAQQLILMKQAELEESKKKSDKRRVDGYKRKIEELGAEMAQTLADVLNDIIGSTAESIAKDFGDAFFDATKSGEDAMEAWHKKSNELIGDIIKKMLVAQYLEPEIGKIFNKYQKKWFTDGKFNGTQAVMDSSDELANDINKAGEDFNAIYSILSENLKKYLGAIDAARSATEKGIATASQDSVDELNGRTTAIQGHTFTISENSKILVQTTTQILLCVLNIESETTGFGARLERMESSLRDVRNSIDDIAMKGIKIK